MALTTSRVIPDRIFIAHVTVVEIISAISRRVLYKTATKADADKAIAAFRHDYIHQYNLLEITDQIIDHGSALAETYMLRAYDAVQLAAAATVNAQLIAQKAAMGISPLLGSVLILISSDNELNNAAMAEGLTIEDPCNH